jgi:two-component system KDP operon response regulator KdpE
MFTLSEVPSTLNLIKTKKMHSGAKHILLIGHSGQSNEHIKRMLPGYEVITKQTIAEGESIMQFYQFDLVVTEYSKPGINGNLFLKNIKDTSNIPVFVLSVNQNENEIISLYNNGADEVMKMPFLEYEFVQRIHNLLH